MSRFTTRTAWLCWLSVIASLLILVPAAFATSPGGTLASAGTANPILPFSQNKQNEPAIAIDAAHQDVVVAGANDNIDLESCNAGDPTTCPFTPGVGVSGVYFSFDRGNSWTQPSYTGYTARTCLGPAACAASTPPTLASASNAGIGTIGTLPGYIEAGLVSNGDPAVAFGPKPGPDGTFSWANGSRLYYANLAGNFSADRSEQGVKGVFAVAVSRTDDVAAAAAGSNSAWMAPVIASKQSSTTFSDKEQIWADNASSSTFFGTVYICYAQFRSNGSHKNGNAPVPLTVLVSRDGGSSWDSQQLTPAGTDPNSNNATGFGISGCTVRTDSHGTAYIFGERFTAPFALPTHAEHVMLKSTDGGKSWTKAIAVQNVVDPCFVIDPVIGRCVEDGIAGARNDLAASPSVSIANGAPFGAGATNEIVDVWADGRDGLNHESVLVTYSTNGGTTWSAAAAIQGAGERGYYAAPALSPDGKDLYVVYDAFTTPYRDNTSDPRALVGVVKHADVLPSGAPSSWIELDRGAAGDPRASSQNNLQAGFLGDYVYAAATNEYGTAVWNDVRRGQDCPKLDAWRMSLRDGSSAAKPAPNSSDCPNTSATWFGNTDIFAGSYPDPNTP